MSKIEITTNKGFHLEFNNGFNISVQIGEGNYCDNKPKKELYRDFNLNSTNAEIMIWRMDEVRSFVPKGHHDSVIGWVDVEKLGKIIGILSGAKSSRSVRTMLTKIFND